MKTARTKWLRFVTVITFLLLAMPVVASAGRGFYVIDKSARPGMLMSLTASPDVVEPASDKTAEKLVGVMGDAPTDLDIQEGQTQIQTDGVIEVLVSTINGDIKAGDRIVPSSLLGFGAKSTGNGWIVGLAQDSFDAATKGAVQSKAVDSSGREVDVHAGRLRVLVKVTYFSQQNEDPEKLRLPRVLQSIADNIANKRATQTAIILGFFLVFCGLVVSSVILYTAIRNGIVAIARQPLTKDVIMRKMIQVCMLAFALLLATIGGAAVIIRVV